MRAPAQGRPSVPVVCPSGQVDRNFRGVGQTQLAPGAFVERGVAQPDDVSGARAWPQLYLVTGFHMRGDLPVHHDR